MPGGIFATKFERNKGGLPETSPVREQAYGSEDVGRNVDVHFSLLAASRFGLNSQVFRNDKQFPILTPKQVFLPMMV